ncbi:MAG: hypothetical protein ABFD83_07500 [Armatimonadota bacterium]
MDDRQIEDMLRKSWQPEPPNGMRERVITKAKLELTKHRQERSLGVMRLWKTALVAAIVLFVIIAWVGDSARQNRIDIALNGASVNSPDLRVAQTWSPEQWERQRSRIMSEFYPCMKGDRP